MELTEQRTMCYRDFRQCHAHQAKVFRVNKKKPCKPALTREQELESELELALEREKELEAALEQALTRNTLPPDSVAS